MISMRPCAKSDSSLISRFSFAAALASLTLLLFACPNPTTSDQPPSAPISTDLSVTATVPANGAAGFDPSQSIAVTFNKEIDSRSLTPSAVVISESKASNALALTLSLSIDKNSSKTLLIEPHPYLEPDHSYMVSFVPMQLKDTSGQALPKQVDFSFTTGTGPAGDIQINGGTQYAKSDSVTLTLPHNITATWVSIADSEANLSSPHALYDGAVDPAPQLTFANDGTKTVYVQFYDSSTKTAKSTVRSAKITCDTLKPMIQQASISASYYNADNLPYYNMFNNASNPLHGTATATDDTSGVASYSWTSVDTSVHFVTSPTNSAQSPAIWIDGGEGTDRVYGVTLSVKDNAGNESSQSFTIIKYTAHPGQPTEGLGSDSHKPPIVDQNPTVTWKWVASSNIDSPPDTFLVKLDTETTWNSLPLSTTSLSKSSLADGIYNLQVIQMDAVGNQSNALIMQIVVTPVVPWDGSTTTTDSVPLGWRNFFGPGVLPAEDWYHVHLWPDGDTKPEDAVDYYGPATIREKLVKLSPGQTYDWYIEWSNDNGTTYLTGNRSPSNDPPQTPLPYHQFTAF